MDKSPEAFRTISEVAESLETPAHVLRFWESRFPQIKPVKRAGGRRYYRPADVALLSGIRHLLHNEGMTIRGVQKILREQGVRHVAAMTGGAEVMDFDAEVLEGEGLAPDLAAEEPATAQLYDLETGMRSAVPPDAALGEVVRLHPAAPVAPEVVAEPVAPVAAELVPAPEPLPTRAAEDEVPEAGHVWVEDEPELTLAPPTDLFAAAARVRPVPEAEKLPEPEAAPDLQDHDQPIMLSGLAARLRALPRPLSAAAKPEMEDLYGRLGLLHAQIAQVLRQRS